MNRFFLFVILSFLSCSNEEIDWEKREKVETYLRLVQDIDRPPPLSSHCEFIEYANELCQPMINPME